MKKVLLHLLLLTLLVSCKTHKEIEQQNDIRREWEGELLSSSISHIQVSGIGKEKNIRSLSGSLRIWSAPDSLGNQYLMADMDFNAESNEEKEEETNTDMNASVFIEDRNRTIEEDQSFSREIKKTDNRLLNTETLYSISVILILIILMIWLIKRKREHN